MWGTSVQILGTYKYGCEWLTPVTEYLTVLEIGLAPSAQGCLHDPLTAHTKAIEVRWTWPV